MAGRLTVKERAQIAARYEVWNSVVAVQRWWRGAGVRRRCTGQNITHWNNWRTGFGKLSPTSHMNSCRRLVSIPGRLRKLVDAAGTYVEF